MSNNLNEVSPFVKLAAVVVVGSVAKALFGQPRVYNVREVADAAKDVAASVKK
jgi:hypothetical protein